MTKLSATIDLYETAPEGPPPSYNVDLECRLQKDIDEKRLAKICSTDTTEQTHAAPLPIVIGEEKTTTKGRYQRRFGCLSLFWWSVIFDIFATAIALVGTIGATVKCRKHCDGDELSSGYSCDNCNHKFMKGITATGIIFAIITACVIVGRITACCRRCFQSPSIDGR